MTSLNGFVQSHDRLFHCFKQGQPRQRVITSSVRLSCQKARSAPSLSLPSAAYKRGFTTGSEATGGRHFRR